MTRLHTYAFAATLCLLSSGAQAQSEMPVSLQFAGEVGGVPFACGSSYDNIGAPAATITPTDYRFYISGLELLDKDGKSTLVAVTDRAPWQGSGLTLIDFEDGTGPAKMAIQGSTISSPEPPRLVNIPVCALLWAFPSKKLMAT